MWGARRARCAAPVCASPRKVFDSIGAGIAHLVVDHGLWNHGVKTLRTALIILDPAVPTGARRKQEFEAWFFRKLREDNISEKCFEASGGSKLELATAFEAGWQASRKRPKAGVVS
jgi:hypothetical protein